MSTDTVRFPVFKSADEAIAHLKANPHSGAFGVDYTGMTFEEANFESYKFDTFKKEFEANGIRRSAFLETGREVETV